MVQTGLIQQNGILIIKIQLRFECKYKVDGTRLILLTFRGIRPRCFHVKDAWHAAGYLDGGRIRERVQILFQPLYVCHLCW